MGQLIRSTTTSFEAIRFSQNARLVPSDQVDIERRKAIARHNAFRSREPSGGATMDMNYINRVNKTFAVKKAVASASATVNTGKMASQPVSRPSSQSVALSSSAPAPSAAEGIRNPATVAEGTAAEAYTGASIPSASNVESEAAYDTQRGAFELRVAKGELSYVPAMVMTIITQYPEVNFEYLGGFNYVPASWEPMGSNMHYSA